MMMMMMILMNEENDTVHFNSSLHSSFLITSLYFTHQFQSTVRSCTANRKVKPREIPTARIRGSYILSVR